MKKYVVAFYGEVDEADHLIGPFLSREAAWAYGEAHANHAANEAWDVIRLDPPDE